MPQIPANPIATIISGKPNLAIAVDVNPNDLKFETQHVGEKVYIKARAHPFVNVGWIINIAFLLILPAILILVYFWIPFNFEITEYVPLYTIYIVFAVYYSVVYTNALFNFLDWYYDLYLITNERIIDIRFDPLKTYRITESKLSDIEHVEETVVGFFPNLFNYGDVRVSTSARRGLFIFKSVPKPSWFRDSIADLTRYFKKGG